jgi:hypothetical protein
MERHSDASIHDPKFVLEKLSQLDNMSTWLT